VDGRNYLGIYLSEDTATVVCLGSQGRDRNVLGCFSVSIEEEEEPSLQILAGLIAQGCAERQLQFSEAVVALDCAMFMQHNLHSEFEDPKQVAATIRFDTEEVLATDISDVAIAFKITSSDQAGSKLTVFTAQRKILSDILASLQSNNVDPVSIEPDVNCLWRFIRQNVSLPEDLRPFFGVLSRRRGYFIVPHLGAGVGLHKQSAVRTFLISRGQNRGELLAREILVTIALVETEEPVNCLKVFDSADSVDYQQLGEKLGIEAGLLDLVESAATGPEVLADCADPAEFAIAYGAALACLEKEPNINFRSDFMPYQGKRVLLEKALKFLSISVGVLMLALGMYVTLQLLRINKDRREVHDKLKPDYAVVMLNRELPAKIGGAVKKLESEERRIRDERKGLLDIKGEKAVSAKLILVLEAFNQCAAQTGLNIDSVSITSKSISIEGNTTSSSSTQKLRKALIKRKLGNLQERLETKSGRHHFSITIVPEK